MALTFWYDFSSSYSFLAATRLGPMAQAAGVEVTWQPFLLGPIFMEAGYGGSPNLIAPDKANYMWRDIARQAEAQGEAFQTPGVFPQKSVAAGRVALALPDEERTAFSVAVFRKAFGEGRDIGDLAVVAEAAREAGLDADAVTASAADPAAKAALFAAVDRAKELKIFGAPTFITSDGELFWGNDRLADALAWEASGRLATQ